MEYVELTNAGHIDPHVVNELDDDSQQVAEAMVQLGNMGYYPPEQVPDGSVEGDGMEFKIHQLSRHDQGIKMIFCYTNTQFPKFTFLLSSIYQY